MRIVIRNFGSIANADVELKKITLLIGEQASGKSTLAKAVYFFKSLKDDIYKTIRYNHQNRGIEAIVISSIQNKFAKFFGSSKFYDSNFELKYFYTETEFIQLHQKETVLQITFSRNNFQYNITSQLNPVYENIKRYLNDIDALDRCSEQLRRTINNLFSDELKSLFIPAGRNLSVSYPEFFQKIFYSELSSSIDLIPTKNIQFKGVDLLLMQDFIFHVETQLKGVTFDETNEISEKILDILKHRYRFDNNVEKLILKGHRFVRLDQSSTGQQEAIRLLQDAYLTVNNGVPVFRVIEEPEAHLFPKAQKKLLEILVKVANSTSSQLLLTTHSPYLLVVLNNLMYASQIKGQDVLDITIPSNECRVYQLEETENKGFFNSVLVNPDGLIEKNYLDTISEEIGADFERLYEIEANPLTN